MAKIVIGGPTSRSRGLNTVQTFLRLVIWLVSFAIFFGLTVFLSGVMAAVSDVLAVPTLAVGGFISLILAFMFARTLYVIPEYERVVLLKLGKFVGVKGPGLFWVIPYPPFFRSVGVMRRR